VGESERQIREVFKKAKEKAEEGMPVIVFFDEMDALFRTRGTGISSDIESTIVPQFLSEIDGVERLRNVIVIGASNRQDLIDPAILRPGRLDVKIRIDRPDKRAAKAVFSKYLLTDLPYDADELAKDGGNTAAAIDRLIQQTVDQMYSQSEENKFLEVTYANGEKEMLYFKDFVSGALIEGVVSRAKKYAIKRTIATGHVGVRGDDLLQAMRDEFKEHEDLPNTTQPDDWAKIAGKKGEKIVHVRTMGAKKNEPRQIETISTGHYL
jgi:proteasome-associated ATPase